MIALRGGGREGPAGAIVTCHPAAAASAPGGWCRRRAGGWAGLPSTAASGRRALLGSVPEFAAAALPGPRGSGGVTPHPHDVHWSRKQDCLVPAPWGEGTGPRPCRGGSGRAGVAPRQSPHIWCLAQPLTVLRLAQHLLAGQAGVGCSPQTEDLPEQDPVAPDVTLRRVPTCHREGVSPGPGALSPTVMGGFKKRRGPSNLPPLPNPPFPVP